jgi:hypothetical protein
MRLTRGCLGLGLSRLCLCRRLRRSSALRSASCHKQSGGKQADQFLTVFSFHNNYLHFKRCSEIIVRKKPVFVASEYGNNVLFRNAGQAAINVQEKRGTVMQEEVLFLS